MHGLQVGLLAAVAVVVVILRQVFAQRVNRIALLIVPGALAWLAWRNLPAGAFEAAQAWELAAGVALSLVCGALQAALTEVFERDGQWWMRGGWRYLAVWAVFLALRAGLLAASGGLGAAQANLWMVWVDLAVLWCVRAGALYFLHPQIGEALAGGRR